jgi:hypothetical protein
MQGKTRNKCRNFGFNTIHKDGKTSNHCENTVCPSRYCTRDFFNNFTINEDIATKFEADLPLYVRKVTTS